MEPVTPGLCGERFIHNCSYTNSDQHCMVTLVKIFCGRSDRAGKILETTLITAVGKEAINTPLGKRGNLGTTLITAVG